jgi:large subunit ribosomal protein L20
VQVDRKVLANIAANDATTFAKLADVAKAQLN